VDLRTQTSLLAAVLTLAIAATALLRPRKRKVHWLFGVFGLSIGLWYLTAFFGRFSGLAVWERVNLVCAVLLPLAGVQFFRAFIPGDHRLPTYLNRIGLGVGIVLIGVVWTPLYATIVLKGAIFSYVLVMLVASLAFVYARGRAATSRFEGARLVYLALVGALATTFTLVDYLPYVGLDIPPVGTVLILIFLYVLSQSVLRYRLLDLYELAGRLTVLTAVAFTLAGIFWVLVELAGGRFFLHSVVAALVVLLLFDPVRSKVEEKITQFFFKERYDLEQAIVELRRQLAHVLEIDDLTRVLMAGLERSRRVTHAAFYMVDEDARGYDLAASVGPEPVRRVEIAPARPLLDRLLREEAIVRETVERELDERREMGEEREAETLFEILQTLEAMQASVCVAVRGDEGKAYGLIVVRDERLRDAFSPEEVLLLRGIAAQAAIAIENSRLYRRMKERDRLAALGEMAAGLAHEIRNPLGSIKASAQFLAEPDPGGEGQPPSSEFLDIIVEEVDRLNRVVSSFLDFARPSKGDPAPTDVNSAIQRTMHLLSPECQEADVRWSLSLEDSTPPVRIDVEQLRQVLINLVQNAIHAMESGGELFIGTALREKLDVYGVTRRWVEIRVSDTGPGIPKRVLSHLFVPFVTTKDRGTGLGLAISHRLVTAAGGHIDVRTHAGVGSTFVIELPVVDEPSMQTGAEPSPGASVDAETARPVATTEDDEAPTKERPKIAAASPEPAGVDEAAADLSRATGR
jgi:signal transduction histidine kinase